MMIIFIISRVGGMVAIMIIIFLVLLCIIQWRIRIVRGTRMTLLDGMIPIKE
jgi:hypothetical protein